MRKEKPIEYSSSNKLMKISSEEINFDDNSNVAKAINMLSPQPKADLLNTILMEKHIKKLLWKKKNTSQQYMNP